jgi:hypothetical protein
MSDYRDYLWTEDWPFFTSDGYCLALVGNSTPEDVLSKLSALDDRLTVTGVRDAFITGYDLGERHGVDGDGRQLAAVADAGDGWTIMIQAPGYIGISQLSMGRIIVDHEVVAHGADRFVWWSGGAQRISFEPLLPQSDLRGVLADRQPEESRTYIIGLIDEVGGIDLAETPGREFHHVAGSFALAERLTGVRITAELLTGSRFMVAVVPHDAST